MGRVLVGSRVLVLVRGGMISGASLGCSVRTVGHAELGSTLGACAESTGISPLPASSEQDMNEGRGGAVLGAWMGNEEEMKRGNEG